MAANERFGRSRPYDGRGDLRDDERPNRRHMCSIKDRLPVDAAIGGREDASGGAANVVDPRIDGNSDHCGSAVAYRSDVTVLELSINVGIDLHALGRDQTRRAKE